MLWHTMIHCNVFCVAVCGITDEESCLQGTSIMHVHEATAIAVSGASSYLQKRLER